MRTLTEMQSFNILNELCDNDISVNSRSYVTGLVCNRLVHKECKDALCSLEASSEVRDVHISMKKIHREM